MAATRKGYRWLSVGLVTTALALGAVWVMWPISLERGEGLLLFHCYRWTDLHYAAEALETCGDRRDVNRLFWVLSTAENEVDRMPAIRGLVRITGTNEFVIESESSRAEWRQAVCRWQDAWRGRERTGQGSR